MSETPRTNLAAYNGVKYLLDECAALEIENRKLVEALNRIAGLADAPEIDAEGQIQLGLHCGVEDRACADRYQGANYGYACGVNRALEWARNEAQAALANNPALPRAGNESKTTDKTQSNL